jgi:beta-lactamase regulating signal transducer with metallopeptidase domain
MKYFVEMTYWVINVSLISSLVIVLFLLYRRFGHYNRSVNILMWIIISLRLLVPASYLTPYSIVGFYKLIGVNVTTTGTLKPFYLANVISQAVDYKPLVLKSNFLYVIFQYLSIIWFIGVIVIVLTYFISYFNFQRLSKRSRSLGKISGLEVYENIKISSPFLYGIAKPIVFVPVNFNKELLKYVILHENAHRHRLDNLKRLIALIVCSIHWFNPLVWVCFKIFREDLEIETDQKVIRLIGEENQEGYFRHVINSAQNNSILVGAGFSSNPLFRRIETQLEKKQDLKITLTIIGLLLLLSYFVLLANV